MGIIGFFFSKGFHVCSSYGLATEMAKNCMYDRTGNLALWDLSELSLGASVISYPIIVALLATNCEEMSGSRVETDKGNVGIF